MIALKKNLLRSTKNVGNATLQVDILHQLILLTNFFVISLKKIGVKFYPMTKDELGNFYCDTKKFGGIHLDYKCEILEKGLKNMYQYYFNKL